MAMKKAKSKAKANFFGAAKGMKMPKVPSKKKA